MPDPSNTSNVNEARYRIGAVCQLTGLSPHVLRIWEKRYAVVKPARGKNQRRLYSEQDISKLSLLKSLVDRGQAIGSIASLGVTELEQRLQQSSGMPVAAVPAKRPRLFLFGVSLGVGAAACANSSIFELAGQFSDAAQLDSSAEIQGIDVAVVEWPNLQPDSVVAATRLAGRLNARHLILVYDYAPRTVLDSLRGARLTALRSPLDIAALEAVVGWRFGLGDPGVADDGKPATLAPPRRFDDLALAHIATQSSTVACECPRHLSQLISRLVRFEAYSAECESLTADDALLHGYLHRITSNARSRFEEALEHVIEMENLSASPTS